MDATGSFWLAAKFLLLLAGLLVPGAMLMRALRLPATVALSFAGSAAAIYATVLGLQFTGVRISLASIAAGLAVVTTAALVLGRSRAGFSPPFSRNASDTRSEGGLKPALLTLYALFWIAVLWRAWREPLAGPDIEFRWSFLAEQMLRHGSLDFYPPRSAEDFTHYFWAESIPPGVSALHAWAFACAGMANAAWTVPAVVLQIVSLHELIWRTAARVGGMSSAQLAILAAAACPLLTWSLLLGQETGLTALALVGVAFAIAEWRGTRAPAWGAIAGVFATLGAMAREYGLVFPAIATVTWFLIRTDRRTWIAFVAVAALGLVWPVRTWVLTGNPFHSLDVAGIFPTNVRFLSWIEHDAAALGAPLQSAAGWGDVLRYLALFAPTAALGAVALVLLAGRRHRDAVWALSATLIVAALWAASVRYTNGGLFYSLRVLAPALALGALAVGIAGAALAPGAPRRVAAVVIGLGLMTLPATLALPQNPWRTPWRAWPAFTPQTESVSPDPTLAVLLKLAGRSSDASATTGVVLADSPGYQRRFQPHGIRVIPLWSSQADWLFDLSLPASEAVRRWRESGVRHLIVTKWQTNLDFFNTRSRWARPPFQVQLVGETATTAVFSIRAVE